MSFALNSAAHFTLNISDYHSFVSSFISNLISPLSLTYFTLLLYLISYSHSKSIPFSTFVHILFFHNFLLEYS
jgi:hypothetical protein